MEKEEKARTQSESTRLTMLIWTLILFFILAAVLAITTYLQGNKTERARQHAEAQKAEAEKHKSEAEKQKQVTEKWERGTRRQAGQAYLLRAKELFREKRYFEAQMFVGRAIGFEGLGNPESELEKSSLFKPHLDFDTRFLTDINQILSFPAPRLIWSIPPHHHSGEIFSIAFSPDGKTVGSGSYDKTIKLWNVKNGDKIVTLKGHSGSVLSIAFSPDGKVIGSGSYDKTIKLWDIKTKKEIATLLRSAGQPDQ